MSNIQKELEIFNRFNFERPLVGVKFFPIKPKGLKELDKVLDFCEMLVEAQEGKAFYAAREDFTCVGPLLLGMVDSEPVFESGLVGPELEIFKEARANKRLYPRIPRLDKGTVNYVAFAPLDRLSFEPDVLIVTADVSQAEILLRAHSYTTGKVWSVKGTPVMSCAWLFIYPYLSGELNFTVTGFGFGMKARKLFPEGLVLVSIPWDLLPGMIKNLRDMKWVPHSYTIGREAHKRKVKKITGELKQKLSASK
jgi:uncharacterized protein (DUF169 family)